MSLVADVLLCLLRFPGMLPVHPAGVAARHRPPARRRGEGEGGGGRAGGPAVAAAAPLAAAQQLAAPPHRGQGRAVRGGRRREEGQRRGVHRGQLLLPHHRRVHRRQGISAEGGGGRGEGEGFSHIRLPSTSSPRVRSSFIQRQRERCYALNESFLKQLKGKSVIAMNSQYYTDCEVYATTRRGC